MLASGQLLAYPLLLMAIYGIYRVGKGRGARANVRFEWMRLGALATMLGLVMALQVRFVAAGYVTSPFGILGATLSIAGVFGLVGVNLLEIWDTRRGRTATGGTTAAISVAR